MHNNALETLLATLSQHGLKAVSHQGEVVNLERGYDIKVEGPNLFKLLERGLVVAPFDDREELCQFIKMDMELNAGG